MSLSRLIPFSIVIAIWFTGINRPCLFAADDPAGIVTCTRTIRPPVIDGVLNDETWATGQVLHSFTLLSGRTTAEDAAYAVLLYDDANLYVAALLLKGMGQPPRFDSLWHGDSLELFLRPDLHHDSYYQIAGNGRDVFLSRFQSGTAIGMNWPGNAVIAVKTLAHGWCIEMAIPFSAFNCAAPDGQRWTFNLCRNDANMGASSFARVQGSFHEPQSFSPVLFRTSPASAPARERTTQADPENMAALHGSMAKLEECYRRLENSPAPSRLLAERMTKIRQSYQELTLAPELAHPFQTCYWRWSITQLTELIRSEYLWQFKTIELFISRIS